MIYVVTLRLYRSEAIYTIEIYILAYISTSEYTISGYIRRFSVAATRGFSGNSCCCIPLSWGGYFNVFNNFQ